MVAILGTRSAVNLKLQARGGHGHWTAELVQFRKVRRALAIYVLWGLPVDFNQTVELEDGFGQMRAEINLEQEWKRGARILVTKKVLTMLVKSLSRLNSKF